MSTLGEANNIHKATPKGGGAFALYTCEFCDEPIKQVPGGQGPTWVHEATGAVAGRHDPDQYTARRLVENILRDTDKLAPELIRLLHEHHLVPGDGVDLPRLTAFLSELSPWVEDVLALRNLSNRAKHEQTVQS